MVKVSVVIPVYKVEAYLPACLDSVLSQSLREIEVIAVDDASPDRCGAILDEYAARDSRVHVIHLPVNRRQGYGRDRGMAEAKGKYIYFLDSDDMITPTALEELWQVCEQDRLQAVFFDSQVLYDSAALARRYASYPARRRGSYPDAVVTGVELLDAFVRQEEWTCYVQRQFWSLDFLRREGVIFPEGVEHEDELFAFEGILAAERVRYLPKDYFIRRYREESVMTTPPTAKNFHGYFMNFWKGVCFTEARAIASYGARRNLGRLWQLYTRYYEELHEKEDLSAWFREDELDLYRFFRAGQQAQEVVNELRPGLAETLRGYEQLYIYGAGALAKRAIRCLSYNGFAIDGVVVTRAEGNPAALQGHRVLPFSALEADREHTILLLAMTKGYADEVEETLRRGGWHSVRLLA